jgi:hypothetical protein
MKRSKPSTALLLTLIAFLLYFGLTLSSCATQGYGCKGKESWNGMVKRINSY